MSKLEDHLSSPELNEKMEKLSKSELKTYIKLLEEKIIPLEKMNDMSVGSLGKLKKLELIEILWGENPRIKYATLYGVVPDGYEERINPDVTTTDIAMCSNMGCPLHPTTCGNDCYNFFYGRSVWDW